MVSNIQFKELNRNANDLEASITHCQIDVSLNHNYFIKMLLFFMINFNVTYEAIRRSEGSSMMPHN